MRVHDKIRTMPDQKKHRHHPINLQHARQMRREPTKAEKLMWSKLRNRQLGDYKFRRQHLIGNYIVDFYCAETHLIVEVDGESHAFQEEYDRERTGWLEEQGYHMFRFANLDVLQHTDSVLEAILIACDEYKPPP